MPTKLLYMVSHPIQYQAPLLRRIAAEPDIALKVLFLSDRSSRAYFDEGFGREVAWDVPLRDGYVSALLDEVELDAELANCDALWVHGWQHTAMRRALKKAQALGKLTLMRGENWDGAMPDPPGLKGWLKRQYLSGVFKTCTRFLCIGSQNRAYYKSRGIAEDRLFSMPYAVDNAFFAERASSPVELDLPPGRKVILFAGKLMRRKHPDWLLKAWKQAWTEGERPILLFVGDGEMREELQAQAGSDVIFTGFRNQTKLPSLYARADVFVLPAEREAWGLAINEAMACGTAVLASDQVGAAFDLISPDCGCIFPVAEPEKLVAALRECVDNSEAMGLAARRRIADWDFEADVKGLREALT